MLALLNFLGLLGFLAGGIGLMALVAQRDADREREEAARREQKKAD